MTFFPGRAKKGQRPLSLGAAARELFDTRVFSLPPCGGSRADFAKAELSPARDPGIASYPLELFRHPGPNKKSWPSPLEGDRRADFCDSGAVVGPSAMTRPKFLAFPPRGGRCPRRCEAAHVAGGW